MLNRLKEAFSISALSKASGGKAEEMTVMTKGEVAFNFAVESGFIEGLQLLQERSGGAFRVVKQTVGEEFFALEVNMPSWQRHSTIYDRLEKKDTTLVVIKKSRGIFSDSYRLSTTTDVLWDESYYDFCSGQDAKVYSLGILHEKNATEKTLRHLAKRAENLGLLDKKRQETPVEKQQKVSNDKPKPRTPFNLRL